MRKIILHGHLAERWGESFELDVQTAGEALRALNANLRGFYKSMEEGAYEVVRGDPKTGLALAETDINEFRLGQADLHFIPVPVGAKRGGLLKAILGVVLVGAAIFSGGGALAATGMLSGITWGNVAVIGLGMAIAGVSQLITPTQKEDKSDKKDSSYALSGATNLYEQGNPIPLVYGRVIVGAQMISAGIDIEQMKNKGGSADPFVASS